MNLQTVLGELDLLKAILKGYPDGPAKWDGLRAVEVIKKAAQTDPTNKELQQLSQVSFDQGRAWGEMDRPSPLQAVETYLISKKTTPAQAERLRAMVKDMLAQGYFMGDPTPEGSGQHSTKATPGVSEVRLFYVDGKAAQPASFGPKLPDGFHWFQHMPEKSGHTI